ncbi:MAG: hypothetical protein ACRDTX_20280 [Pseudonocardiaceae bacterium]
MNKEAFHSPGVAEFDRTAVDGETDSRPVELGDTTVIGLGGSGGADQHQHVVPAAPCWRLHDRAIALMFTWTSCYAITGTSTPHRDCSTSR